MANDDLRWFERNHVRYAVGLLEEAEESRCEEILSQHDEARELNERTEREYASGAQRHIPSAMIARWDRVENELQGLERQSVRAHLERCDDCRGDLTTFGFEPTLSESPRLQRVDAPEPTRSRFDLRSFFTGGIGGLTAGIAAAIAVMTFLPQPQAPEPGEVLPWVAPSRTRGAVSQLAITDQTTQVMLTLAVPTGCDLEQPAEVRVQGPDGSDLDVTIPISSAALNQITVLAVLRDARALPAGEYSVDFRQNDASLETSQFELVTR